MSMQSTTWDKNWEVVIGLETHVQLATQTKIFSGASTAFGAAPNTQACALDMALPGTLPVLNRAAVECAIKFGLAVNATIAPQSIFARKNYFYPDLPKGYQISQYDMPVVQGGTIGFVLQEGSNTQEKTITKTITLTRAHLEEDAGKSLHENYVGMSGIDLNRAGTPLLEIVTEPDMRSAQEAVAYAKTLHSLVVWLGICDGNMQDGSFRCDANVSVRRRGTSTLGTRREIKNLNSFRFLEQAIHAEVRYQIETLEEGGKITQATVLFDPEAQQTRAMRSKEDAHDYRYFPDPDLLPLVIDEAWVATLRDTLPELPHTLRQGFIDTHQLSAYDAQLLTSSRALANYFVAVAQDVSDKKIAANWVLGEVSAQLNASGLTIAQAPVAPTQLAGVLQRILDNTINQKTAKEVFLALWNKEAHNADEVIERRGLKQISDSSAIEKVIDDVLAANAAMVAEFQSGKEKAFNALVGQCMKATQGKVNPAQLNTLLKQKLGKQ